MKKIVISIAILVLVMLAYSCSKDHDAPTFSQYSSVKKPASVVAVYDAAVDSFIITWDMPTPNDDVIDYYIAVSDSAKFNGLVFTQSSGSLVRRYAMSSGFIPSTADTVVRYFAVHAVYNNDDLTEFIGPRSDPDSALFIR